MARIGGSVMVSLKDLTLMATGIAHYYQKKFANKKPVFHFKLVFVIIGFKVLKNSVLRLQL